MSRLAFIDFHFDLDFNEIELQEAESYLKDLTYKYASLIFNQDVKIDVWLKDGSLKAAIVVIGALYIGIGQYGSFRSGIDYIIKDAKTLKELITSEIVKNGLNESDIIESKRHQCEPDRIRRVLLAIDRIESNLNLDEASLKREISKIKTSVSNICDSLADEDAGLLVMSINKKYWPIDRKIPYFIEQYKRVAREEDIVHYPVASLEEPRVKQILK